MLRHALVIAVSPLFLFGCASARTLDLVGAAPEARAHAPSADARAPEAAEAGRELVAPPLAALEPESQPVTFDPALVRTPAEESLHSSRFTIKGGYYGSAEDELDDGYIVNVSWMRFFSRLFALEFEAGYLDADGSDGGVDADLWSVPLMINGRLNAPLWILDVYGGLGAGTLYYDAEASGAVTESDDGFLLAGNAFVGATLNLADAIALGLEGKYYVTDEISDFDTGLDAYAVMLTLGFSR